MNIPDNIQSQIDRFLWGHMSDSEAKDFENEIASNNQLKAQVEQIRIEHEAMQQLLEVDLDTNIAQWKAEKKANSTEKTVEPKVVEMKRRSPWMRRLAAAAGVLIVIGFGFLFLTAGNYSNQSLGNKYFDQTAFAQRSINTEIPDFLKEPIDLIRKDKMDEALTSLKSIAETNDDVLVQTLIGEVNFQKENYKEAAGVFEKIIQNTESSNTKKETEMKLLMTYLADGRMEDFEKLKSEILAANDNARKAQIEALTQDMNSFRRWFSK